jgi:predicted transposase/invertase (TIGR01784 family)
MTIHDKYIDPFTDFGFKWIFGTEENKKFLISFLNDLLDIDYPIVDITYRSLEKLGLNIIDRKAIFDVYCTDTKNNKFIVELQRSKQKYFKDRSYYYTTFPIQEQSKRGDWDYSLKKVFFVGILEFNMDESKDYIHRIKPMNIKTKEVFFEKLEHIFIEMPKFKKSESELSNHLEYWLYFFNNLNSLKEVPKILKEDKVINEAFDVAQFLALDKDAQWQYQQDLKARWDNKACMDYAIETATEEGLKQGQKIGLEQGLEQGRKAEKIEIAKVSLLNGLDIETVSNITGLTIEEIKKISRS